MIFASHSKPPSTAAKAPALTRIDLDVCMTFSFPLYRFLAPPPRRTRRGRKSTSLLGWTGSLVHADRVVLFLERHHARLSFVDVIVELVVAALARPLRR